MDDNSEERAPTRIQRHVHWGAAALLSAVFLFVLLCPLLTNWVRPGFDRRNTPEALLAGANAGNVSLPPPYHFQGELSAEQLSFGEQQVQRMAADRPELKRNVSQADPLWQVCARAMGGQAIGEPILWDSGLPEKGYESDHQGPFEGHKGYIRIQKYHDPGRASGQPLNCEELWALAVYELENIRNEKAFMTLYNMALQGQLTREQWIRENSRLEYDALRRTADRFWELWVPMARPRKISSTPVVWGVGTPDTYEEWIVNYRDPHSYPWDVYARYYDRQVIPYLRSRGVQ